MEKKKSLLSNPVLSGLKPHKLKIIVFGMMALFCMSFSMLVTIPLPPADSTGSPTDGQDCSSCHSDYALNSGPGVAAITSTIPGGGYVPSTTYSITVSISQASMTRFQFELSPQNASTGAYLGTLIPVAGNTALVGTKDIAGDPASLDAVGSKSWTFTWTAPATGLGPVTFYAAFNASDKDGVETGDYIYTKTLVTPEAGPLSSGTIASANASCYSMCNGSATSNPTGGTTPYTYLWSTAPVQATQTATGLCAGSYTVVVADAVGATVTSTVAISQPTALTTSMSSTDESVTGNGTATAAPSGGTPSYSYSWATTPPQSTAIATGLVGGTYTVTITDANGCTTTNTVVVNSTVGAVSIDNETSVRVYPIPSRGDIYVEINSLNSEEYTLNVMDVAGKIVHSETIQLNTGKNIRSISLATESEGVFFIQVKSKNGSMKVLPIAKFK